MSKNTNISELINYISVNGSGDIVMTGNLIMPGGAQAATQTYVTTAISNLVASAPSTLDTLNELATALGNDANFATTVATSIGTKQAQLNGTGFVKVTGTTVSYDNATYLTTGTAGTTYLPLAGGTLTVSRSNGTNVNVLILADNLTGVSTPGYGTRIVGYSNGNSVQSVIGFENGGTGTNNESQLSFYTQNVAGSLTRQLLITSTGVANFSNRIEIISNGGTNPVLAIRQTNAATQGYDFETEDVSVGRLDLYGKTVSGRVHMMSWIKATGNVGIGTLSPYSNAKLQVRTGTNINLAFQTGTTDSSGIKLNAFNDAANANVPFELNGSILYFKTGESERMRLTTTGPTTMGCLLVNKTTAASSYPIQTTSTNGAFMASATGSGDANYYSTSPTIGYHIYGDQGGAAKFNVTGGGRGYFAAGVLFGSGSSTLNYYQEGSWTPQLYAGASAFTMGGINEGRYVRVGNLVTISGHLQWSSGSGSGMVRISGLPFACTGVRSAGSMGAVSYGLSFNAGYNHWVLVIDPGADFIYIIQGDSSGGGYSHTPPVGGSGIVYGFSITYHTL
jgi:hypothetical protein